ncbi:unnamed protein product [Sphagnum jensenii]|uniref:Uncharacterized protein n=1 Tax=Sphagnum jensenii TaxID=128206 RepID=A0ABP1C180_9BRYO
MTASRANLMRLASQCSTLLRKRFQELLLADFLQSSVTRPPRPRLQRVQPDGVLSLSARSKTTNFAYRSITIDSYGRNVGMDKFVFPKPPNMATGPSFGVEIPFTINEA